MITSDHLFDQLPDARLVQLAQAGVPQAFGGLYDRYAAELYRFLYAHCHNQLDAEDMNAEVFLRAWDDLPRYRERGHPFSAYLYRIARNLLVDYYRRSGRQVEWAQVSPETLAVQPNPDHHLEAERQSQRLLQAMQALKPDYRSVLILRFINQLSPAEAARVMERSQGALRVLQHRALKALREELDRDAEV
ncbi:MAG: sigma-70 family RNA polymerase sigma factor [Anaerolineales bacterium]|nr:sigma-70 family RNA polymerase sigma factor [Anaerolineales bacterium]